MEKSIKRISFFTAKNALFLIDSFYKAKKNNLPFVTIWGTGLPKREFLFVDDMAKASVYLMNIDKKLFDNHRCSYLNVGSSKDLSIRELSEIIKKIVDYKGKITFDKNKPDGIPRKLLDSKRLNNLGFKAETSLEDGLRKTFKYFLETNANF